MALVAHLSLILARHIKGGWNTRELFMAPLALVGVVCGLIFVIRMIRTVFVTHCHADHDSG